MAPHGALLQICAVGRSRTVESPVERAPLPSDAVDAFALHAVEMHGRRRQSESAIRDSAANLQTRVLRVFRGLHRKKRLRVEWNNKLASDRRNHPGANPLHHVIHSAWAAVRRVFDVRLKFELW